MAELPLIIVDTREKKPWRFNRTDNCRGTISQKLNVGDYSVQGIESVVTIERKGSVSELYGNLGKGRTRFFAEIERMGDMKYKFVVCEFTFGQLLKQPRFSKMSPNSILGSIISLQLKYNVHFIFAGNKGAMFTRKILLKVYDNCLKGKVDGISIS